MVRLWIYSRDTSANQARLRVTRHLVRVKLWRPLSKPADTDILEKTLFYEKEGNNGISIQFSSCWTYETALFCLYNTHSLENLLRSTPIIQDVNLTYFNQ